MKWMKIGAYCGVFLLIFGVLLIFLGLYYSLNDLQDNVDDETFFSFRTIQVFSLTLTIFIWFLSILFYYGFTKLGKFAKSKFLYNCAYLVYTIALIVFVIWLFVFYNNYFGVWTEAFSGPGLFLIFIFPIFFIAKLSFSISLIYMEKKIKGSRVTGIVGLVLMLSFVIISFLNFDVLSFLSTDDYMHLLIGIPYIFETIVLFKASKKFEK